MWMPDWLYASLPIVYAVIGVVVLAVFGWSGPAALSVFMLFLAATLVTFWRYRSNRD